MGGTLVGGLGRVTGLQTNESGSSKKVGVLLCPSVLLDGSKYGAKSCETIDGLKT